MTSLRAVLLRLVLLLVAAAGLAGCYKAPEDRTKAQLRLVNASEGYAALDLNVDGAVVQGNVGYGSTSAYAEVNPDRTASLISATGSATALVSFTATLERNKHYTALAFGRAGTLRQLTVDENQSAPSAGRTKLRVLNAAPDAGALDVYFTAAGEDLPSAVAFRSGAAYGELSAAQEAVSGSWRLRVAAAGSKTDVRLDVPDVALAAGEAAVLVLTATPGGALVNALYIVQQGGIRALAGSQARVRAVAGVLQGAVVNATLGGVTLMNQVVSPALLPRALVPAGAPALNISVNGNSVGAPPTALAVGADYTLLVLGTPALPQGVWLTDPNPLPPVTGKAWLRLVNATTGIGTALSLKIGLNVAASGVAAASASEYREMDAATDLTMVVQDGASSTVFTSANNLVLLAGARYSLFVIGTPGAGTIAGSLERDR